MKPEKLLSLDYANTLYWRTSSRADEQLKSYSNLVRWSKMRNLVTSKAAGQLHEMSRRDPWHARKTFERALELRETIYRIFSSTSRRQSPSPLDIEKLNDVLSTYPSNHRLIYGSKGFEWAAWKREHVEPDFMFWPIAKSAADLLASGKLDRVRECANIIDGCGWLFFDETKNGSRKWCQMQICGNRMKSRRHYQHLSRTQRI